VLLKKTQQSDKLSTRNATNNHKKMADQKKYKVKIPEDEVSGVYSNAVSVHINGNECIIDMAYVIPNAEEPTIKVVSRVNMSHKTAESFLKVLSNSILDWKNKINKKED